MQVIKTYNGATLTFQRGTVKTRLKGISLYGKLGVTKDTPDEDVLAYSYYIRLLTQCEVEGSLGFVLPSPAEDEPVLQKGYQAFMESDEALFDVVLDGLNEIDPDYQPPVLQPDGEKKG